MEAIGSELNLFEPAVIQSAVVGEFVQEFAPIATIIQGSPIDFQIEGGGLNYMDLNNSKLEVRGKLTKPDGTNIATGTRVGVVNLPLHSLFSSVNMKIGEKVVTESNNLYPFRAHMETIINYQEDVLKTRMLCEGYDADTAGQMDVTDPAGANAGLGRREVTFNASKTVRMIGRIHSDLWHQEKLIPPGVKLEVQLVPSRSSFFIKTAAPADREAQVEYKFEIRSARFLIQFKQVSPSMAVAHQKMLQEVNYQIPHTKVLMKTHAIPSGVTSYTINNLFKGRLPDRIAVAMVADKAVSGSYTANPFNFQNFGLNYLALHVNSELVPRIALEPNFTTGDYMREYITVLEALGFDIGPNTWSITPSEWANGYNIYAFKITPGSIGSVRSNQLTGDIGLEAKFSAGTGANITLIVLSEEPATLEIDKFGHVFI